MKKISYKFPLILNRWQENILSRWVGACRFVYNSGLEQRIDAYSRRSKSLSYYDQQNELVECKKTEGLEWLQDVPSQSLQMSLRNLDRAYKNFFRRVKLGQTPGFPKKKRKGRCFDSISFPQGNKIRILVVSNKRSIVAGIPKIKGGLKFRQHRKIEGKIKVVTIKKENGKWWVSFSCEKNSTDNIHQGGLSPQNSIGIDLGITKTIETTNKTYNLDIEKIKKMEKQIAKIQRRMTKQKKFSDRWKKYQKIISKKHSKISRVRKDFLHKVSHELCKNHAIVVMENLNIKNMSKSASGTIESPGKNVKPKSGLNKAILRQGWGVFREFCEYKTKRFGGVVVKVNPQNTSRKCSNCGHIEKNNRKTQTDFLCLKCGHSENADRNAAKNILALGLESLGLNPLEAPS